MTDPISQRFEFAKNIAKEAGHFALEMFKDGSALTIEQKGDQDWVSNADKSVERKIREALAVSFPDDAILGEEEGITHGTTEFTWILDPIDGTTNYISNIPDWCVIVACVKNNKPEIGVIYVPVTDECFYARKGHGAFCNDKPIKTHSATAMNQGSLGVGYTQKMDASAIVPFLDELLGRGGLFYRNGSGGLSLVYVAAGRIIGYFEPFMNSWDCFAGLLMIEEAGGKVLWPDFDHAVTNGLRVVTAGADIYDELLEMTDQHSEPHTS